VTKGKERVETISSVRGGWGRRDRKGVLFLEGIKARESGALLKGKTMESGKRARAKGKAKGGFFADDGRSQPPESLSWSRGGKDIHSHGGAVRSWFYKGRGGTVRERRWLKLLPKARGAEENLAPRFVKKRK